MALLPAGFTATAPALDSPGCDRPGPGFASATLATGLAWMLTLQVQLDASARHRLGGHAPAWEAGLGVSVYFGH